MNLESRVINLEKNSGYFNDAVEQVLLESEANPTLIFTEWKPTVSIGNVQNMELDVNRESCNKHNVSIIRRNSGGQSVYLDERYIVFTLAGPKYIFSSELDSLRRFFSQVIVDTLNNFSVPASFHPPDNAVILSGKRIKTIGNSGQVIKNSRILLQGSIRYSEPDYEKMLNVLKINGHFLQNHKEEISEILSSVQKYNSKVSPKEIKNKLMENFEKNYGLKFNKEFLTKEELYRINELAAKEFVEEKLKDKEWYKTKGVCYFFVGGKNLVNSLSSVLPYNKPSSISDVKLQEEALQYG